MNAKEEGVGDTQGNEAKGAKGSAQSAGTKAPPKVDLSTFILSLGTSALYQMGLVPDPITGEAGEEDLLLAQQTIDTLEMLREKTLGNLDEEERKLFDSLLYELRIKFVEKNR